MPAAFIDAIETELSWLGTPRPVDTLYIGGGTPTDLVAAKLQRLCHTVGQWFPLAAPYEWTVEANPCGLSLDKVQLLARAGVNRISLGVQSFDDRKLALLERDHRLPEILKAYQLCRDHFDSVCLDLIFAVPGESISTWQDDLDRAMALQADHLSIYGLTFEKGARFWGDLQRGRLVEVGEEEQRSMYELAIDRLTENGWEHYEVANFARPGKRSRHNQVYWTGHEYFAAGPGAARYVGGERQTNHRSTFTWLRRVQANRSPVNETETLSDEQQARERLVFGLRMLEGIDKESFCRETGFQIEQLVGEPLRQFVADELIEDTGTGLRLTRRGLLISDALWPHFL
jgi:oxygen-independent coproporphyrinogen-3 oxidase